MSAHTLRPCCTLFKCWVIYSHHLISLLFLTNTKQKQCKTLVLTLENLWCSSLYYRTKTFFLAESQWGCFGCKNPNVVWELSHNGVKNLVKFAFQFLYVDRYFHHRFQLWYFKHEKVSFTRGMKFCSKIGCIISNFGKLKKEKRQKEISCEILEVPLQQKNTV